MRYPCSCPTETTLACIKHVLPLSPSHIPCWVCQPLRKAATLSRRPEQAAAPLQRCKSKVWIEEMLHAQFAFRFNPNLQRHIQRMPMLTVAGALHGRYPVYANHNHRRMQHTARTLKISASAIISCDSAKKPHAKKSLVQCMTIH